MAEDELWEAFKTTGRIADYLRYRGVDIYAAQNTVGKGGLPDDAKCQRQPDSTPPHRRSDYSGI